MVNRRVDRDRERLWGERGGGKRKRVKEKEIGKEIVKERGEIDIENKEKSRDTKMEREKRKGEKE